MKLLVKAVVFSWLVSFGLAACETVEGFGRDVQKVGEAMENEAEREQRE